MNKKKKKTKILMAGPKSQISCAVMSMLDLYAPTSPQRGVAGSGLCLHDHVTELSREKPSICYG